MTITSKTLRKAAAVSLVREAGKATIPDAMEQGLGMALGLDSAGLRYLFKELVKEGVLSSKTSTRKVRTPPHIGRDGHRNCKVLEFSLRESVV